jgi:hypothetical protein
MRLTDVHLAQTLREAANVRLALSVPELTAPAFVARLFGERARGLFFVERRLLIVYDLHVPLANSVLVGRPVTALAADFRFVPVALVGAGGGSRPLNAQATLAPGDRLTVILAQTDLQRLLLREAVSPPSA